MKSFVPAILALLFLATPANAAGFDCAQAGTAVEHLICGDEELSALDELLGDRYVRALRKGEDPKAVKAAQRAWLREVRNACPDTACLKSAYEARIADLTKIGWMTEEKAEAICDDVIEAAIAGTLQSRFLEFKPLPPDFLDILLQTHMELADHPPKRVLLIDYDGDGKTEFLGIFDGEIGHSVYKHESFILDVSDARNGGGWIYEAEKAVEMLGSLRRWATNDYFLVVDEEPVLVTADFREQFGVSVFWLDPDGHRQPLCAVEQKTSQILPGYMDPTIYPDCDNVAAGSGISCVTDKFNSDEVNVFLVPVGGPYWGYRWPRQ